MDSPSPPRSALTGSGLLLAAVVLLALALPLSWHQPYQRVGGDLLAAVEAQYQFASGSGVVGDFEQLFRRFGDTREDGVAWLSLAPGERIRGYLPGPFAAGHVMVSVRVAAQGLERGELSWTDGRVGLVGIDEGGRRLYDAASVVCGVHGDHPASECRTILALPDEAREALLVLGHWGRSGEMRVARPELWSVRTTPVADGLYLLAAALWLALALALARRFLGRPLHILIYLLLVVVVIHTMLPMERFKPLLVDLRAGLIQAADELEAARALPGGDEAGDEVGKETTAKVADLSQGEDPPANGPSEKRAAPPVANPEREALVDWGVNQLQKWGHLAAFALLGALVTAAWYRQGTGGWPGLAVKLGWLVWFAAATEVTQLAIPTRSGALADFVLDISGIVLGVVLIVPLLLLATVAGRVLKFGHPG